MRRPWYSTEYEQESLRDFKILAYLTKINSEKNKQGDRHKEVFKLVFQSLGFLKQQFWKQTGNSCSNSGPHLNLFVIKRSFLLNKIMRLHLPCFVVQLTKSLCNICTRMNIKWLAAVISETILVTFKLVNNSWCIHDMTN